jgi:hypothetical protein
MAAIVKVLVVGSSTHLLAVTAVPVSTIWYAMLASKWPMVNCSPGKIVCQLKQVVVVVHIQVAKASVTAATGVSQANRLEGRHELTRKNSVENSVPCQLLYRQRRRLGM